MQADAAAVAVEHLVTGQVDGVVVRVGEFAIYQRGGLAMFGSEIAAVVGWVIFVDDISTERHAEVVGLTGEVG